MGKQGERNLMEAGEERRVKSKNSFKTITSLQPLWLIQLPERAWWRVEVFTSVGTLPGVTSSIFTEVGKYMDLGLHNLYYVIFKLGMAWWICSRLYPAGFHDPTLLPFLFPSGRSFWTVEQIPKAGKSSRLKEVCVFVYSSPNYSSWLSST